MPAVTVDNILTLPRIRRPDAATARFRPVRKVVTAPRQLEGEGFQVRTARAVGHAHDLDPVGPQHGVEVEIAGIVDQHGVARLQQESADQVDGLGAGLGQHDLAWRHLDPVFGHQGDHAVDVFLAG